jgi:hypothetical protein
MNVSPAKSTLRFPERGSPRGKKTGDPFPVGLVFLAELRMEKLLFYPHAPRDDHQVKERKIDQGDIRIEGHEGKAQIRDKTSDIKGMPHEAIGSRRDQLIPFHQVSRRNGVNELAQDHNTRTDDEGIDTGSA